MIRSSHGSKLLRRLMIGGVALVVPVLAGCEAGNNSPVLDFHPAANGAYGTADAVTVSDAFILGAQDSQSLAKGASVSDDMIRQKMAELTVTAREQVLTEG